MAAPNFVRVLRILYDKRRIRFLGLKSKISLIFEQNDVENDGHFQYIL